MDRYTRLTKAWLESRYRRSPAHLPNVYYGHQPIYGLGSPVCEPNHARRVVRLFQLLRRVRQAGGRTLLDVGGSEGYFGQLCRDLFGMTVMSVDISEEACRRAAEIFGVPGAAVDAASLPFATGSFDVVTCAEVVEHLAQPVPSILELQRVAKGTLVLATEEWQVSASDRDRILAERHMHPHGERSIFADVDMKPLFSPYEVAFERQVIPNLDKFGVDTTIDRAALKRTMVALGAGDHQGAAEMGIVALIRKPGPRVATPKNPTDEQIADHLLSTKVQLHLMGAPTPVVPWPAEISPRCVKCGATLRLDGAKLACTCGANFERRRGVFAFMVDLPPLEQRIDKMLAERGGAAYPQQRADLLALAAKLELPFPAPTSWSFDGTDANAALWHPNPNLVPTGAPGAYRVPAHDPWIQHDSIGHDPRLASLVTVEMAVRTDRGSPEHECAEMYWLTDNQLAFSADCSAGVLVKTDGQFHSYTFEAPMSLRGEMVVGLRLDPISLGTGEVRLKSIRLHGS